MSEVELIDIFAENLRYTMQDVRITQSELARYTGLSEAAISRYLAKKRLPTISALVNMCVVLNCTLDDLIPSYEIIESSR